MKSFKNLFIKEDEDEDNEPSEKPSFPVSEPNSTSNHSQQTPTGSNPFVEEILSVYEQGLEKLNMPGYDFYDFYNAIKAAGSQNEAVFKMAFQMGKTLDATITPQKLVSDAEFYISKINDVHQTYSGQGKKKLDDLDGKLKNERDGLSREAQQIENDISRMKQQIQEAERRLEQTKNDLSKLDDRYKPEQIEIQQKLAANDQAMQISIKRLNAIKESILNYLR